MRCASSSLIGLLVLGAMLHSAGAAAADPATACSSQHESSFLYEYAVELYGRPVSCVYKPLAGESEPGRFGTQTYRFKGGAKLDFEVSPPETFVTTLQIVRPLDEKKVLERLKAGTKKEDLNIDFTQPEVTQRKGTEERIYRDPQEGLNASVFLKFGHGKLKVIGSGLAL